MRFNVNTPYTKSVFITYGAFFIFGIFLIIFGPSTLEEFGVVFELVGLAGLGSELVDIVFYLNRPHPQDNETASLPGLLVYLLAVCLGAVISFLSSSFIWTFIGVGLSVMALAAAAQVQVHDWLRKKS